MKCWLQGFKHVCWFYNHKSSPRIQESCFITQNPSGGSGHELPQPATFGHRLVPCSQSLGRNAWGEQEKGGPACGRTWGGGHHDCACRRLGPLLLKKRADNAARQERSCLLHPPPLSPLSPLPGFGGGTPIRGCPRDSTVFLSCAKLTPPTQKDPPGFKVFVIVPCDDTQINASRQSLWEDFVFGSLLRVD